MNIVFGEFSQDLNQRYTLLELDTFRDPESGQQATAWCVVENIPLEDLPDLATLTNKHQAAMQSWRLRDWDQCRRLCDELRGRWNGELDSFYDVLTTRMDHMDPGSLEVDWDGTIPRSLAL